MDDVNAKWEYNRRSNHFFSTIRSKAKMNPDSVFPVAGGEAAAG
jgi:hypothetical protein